MRDECRDIEVMVPVVCLASGFFVVRAEHMRVANRGMLFADDTATVATAHRGLVEQMKDIVVRSPTIVSRRKSVWLVACRRARKIAHLYSPYKMKCLNGIL